MNEIRDAVIVDYLRSPISRSRPRQPERDMFNSLRMDDVAAMLIEELIKRTGINPEEINDVLTGTAMPMGEQWIYGGRDITFLAKLPFNVPAEQIDRQCASSMSTIHQGAMEIQLGYSDIVISCGIEHMTHNPMPGPGIDMSKIMVEVNPRLFESEYEKYDILTTVQMGLTAEKLFDLRQKEPPHITREEMDELAFRSHQNAAKALEEGFFKDEIMPVEVTLADGTKKVVDHDLSIRADTTLEKIAAVPPAFKPDGAITAGNSSPLNAAATAMILMSKEKAKEYGLDPMAKIVSMGWAGVDPSMMGLGPVPASKMALKHAGLQVKDIDFWEINEAFAVVTVNAIKELGIDPEKVNVKGGAIAIGHPLGATGTRLVGTLARILNLEGGRYGLATPCVGGGQGTATIIEKM
ncbi:MAG: acetyl-CoA C-acetyltransferase [Candidatus Methanolliviera hydrocarbonicum]|uniref:Acetyl-CoA C-acetyltransferase n=1 Tax=Candidatus Methanolliviera hydrocarbonicum TaxID=2491085 RepID=A0A520KVX8_9EURY|nr:MAG: acetyl-CoA C-acetyltransferase [Candidatus Methanolliviera hydrocarbonicum]